MANSEAKAFALFFLFAFMDKEAAAKTASRAFESFQTLSSQNPQLKKEQLIVRVSSSVYHKFKKQYRDLVKPQLELPLSVLEAQAELTTWREFLRYSTEEEILAAIWTHILGIPAVDVAKGIGCTEGTVRFRAGRACRKLGSVLGRASVSRLHV